MRIFLFLVFAALATSVTSKAEARLADDDWHGIRSQNFDILTNGDPYQWRS
jgi:hypothetical protein